MEEMDEPKTFRSLGVCEQLAEACQSLGWTNPTRIQMESLPHALEGNLFLVLESYTYL